MPSGPISLRPAQPTLDEGSVFARYLDVAADGAFRLMLGHKAEQVIAEAVTQPGHDLSHAHVTFAEREGSVVGMSSGYTAEEHHQSTEEPLTTAAGAMGALRMGVVALLGRRMFRFIDAVPEGDFYLQAVAVDDDQRGQGVGSKLIDHLEDRGRERDCTRIVLDVAADNDSARRLYERRGMAVEAESPRLMPMSDMRALRMVKAL